MSALTKNEKDGLEDVFLSIHSNHGKYQKMKELSFLVMTKNIDFSMSTLLKRAKLGLKESKMSHYFTFSSKKKRYLSK